MKQGTLRKLTWRTAAIRLAGLFLFAASLCGCAVWRPGPVPPSAPPVVEPAIALPLSPDAPPVELPPTPPAPRPASKVSPPPPDQVLALQVGLDRLNFSPGCIDGRWGGHTRLALEAWQESVGAPVTGEATDADFERLFPAQPLTTYTVTKEDHGELTDVPGSWRERAKLPWLGYGTVLEIVAERCHASEVCIRRLNPDVAWPDPPVGAILNVPNSAATSSPSAVRLKIDLRRKFVRAYDAREHVVAHFPCSIARLKEKRPQGATTVINAAGNPVYTFDPALFAEDPESREIAGKLIIQPGPNNPVGVAWVGLELPGYGIHGTPWPEDIGKTESHGCIRLANWNARKLVHMVRQGTPVQFVGAWED